MIIGIIGSKGSGKSTVGKHIAIEHGYERISLAEPIKKMLLVLGLTQEHVDGQFKESKNPILCGLTARHAMQTLGTEWGRTIIHPDLWINIWMHKAQPYKNVVCDDVRFPNELDRIQQLSGIILRVRRPSAEGKSAHESEMYATNMKPDHEIWNDGDINELLQKTDKFMTNIRAIQEECRFSISEQIKQSGGRHD